MDTGNGNKVDTPPSDACKVDSYGFERPEDFDYNGYEDFMAEYLSVLARRASKWSSMMDSKKKMKKSNKVKRYIRKGIPSEHRANIWFLMSGAQSREQLNPGHFEKLLKGPHDQELLDSIKTDIDRTFPENIYFQSATSHDPNAKSQSLYNVLVCIAHQNRRIGYCQGMNFIAGLLLLIMKSEEKAFWMMDTLINGILPDYYAEDMVGVKTDQEVLGELVKLKVPEVHNLMQKHGVVWALVCTKWFICLFGDVLPIETLLRVWDCLFYEGNKVLLRVGLSLIILHKDKLLECKNFPEVVTLFKNMTTGKSTLHCHQFMEHIFSDPGSLSSSLIAGLRQTCEKRIREGTAPL